MWRRAVSRSFFFEGGNLKGDERRFAASVE